MPCVLLGGALSCCASPGMAPVCLCHCPTPLSRTGHLEASLAYSRCIGTEPKASTPACSACLPLLSPAHQWIFPEGLRFLQIFVSPLSPFSLRRVAAQGNGLGGKHKE